MSKSQDEATRKPREGDSKIGKWLIAGKAREQ